MNDLVDGPWRHVLPRAARLDLIVTAGPSVEAAVSIYRPSKVAARLMKAAGRRLPPPLTPRASPPFPVDGVLAGHEFEVDTLSMLYARGSERCVVGAAHRRRLTAVAKVGVGRMAEAVSNEARMLAEVGDVRDLPFSTPELLRHDHDATGSVSSLVMRAVQLTGRVPHLPPTAVAGLLVDLARATAPAHLVHGDFAPWNVGVGAAGYVVVDWEEARRGSLSMFDLAHYVAQEGRLLGRRTPAEAVDELTAPGRAGASFAAGAGLTTSPVQEVAEYLDGQLAKWPGDPYLSQMRERL